MHGISENDYAPDQPMTGAELTALILRALGYVEAEPNTTISLGVISGLLTESQAQKVNAKEVSFDRGEMVVIAYHALTTKLKGSEKTLLSKLVEDDKAITVQAAAGTGLYVAPSYSNDPMDQIEKALRNVLDGKN